MCIYIYKLHNIRLWAIQPFQVKIVYIIWELSHPSYLSSSAWGKSQWYRVTYGSIPVHCISWISLFNLHNLRALHTQSEWLNVKLINLYVLYVAVIIEEYHWLAMHWSDYYNDRLQPDWFFHFHLKNMNE